ncbi:MAG: hypothetical protein LBK25_05695 [Treponema sp.]|jgi:hypothetical protein|nr:hypothetical protein [Treponema sp.]
MKIKTAWEIVLERTESIKSDKASIEQFEAKQNGKKIANEFLDYAVKKNEKSKTIIEEALKQTPEEQRQAFKLGVFETLVLRLNLPASKDDMKTFEAVGNGLQCIINDARFDTMFQQSKGIVSRYLDDVDQYEQAIKQQYAPRLRQKEAELSKRMGQQVKIDPFQDPEFAAFYKQNMDALKKKYQPFIDQIRLDTETAFNKQ